MIPFIFLLAFILRVAALVAPAIWYDEAFSLYHARLPLLEVMTFPDFNPPLSLWEVILHPFVTLSPTVEMLRVIALVFAMLTMFVAWRITQILQFTRTQTLFVLLFIAVLPGLLWMGTDGRAYAFTTFFYTLGIYYAINGNRRALFITSLFLLYAHTIGIAFVASLYFYWIVIGKRTLKEAALTAAPLLLAFVPIYIKMTNILTGSLLVDLSVGYFIFQWVMSFFIGIPQILWLIGLLVIFVSLWIYAKDYKSGLLTFTLMPILILIIASIAVSPVIHYRTLSITLIPFAMLAAQSITQTRISQIVAVAWLALLVTGVYYYDFNAKGSQQREAAQVIAAQPDRIVYATITTALPFDYYLHDIPHCILKTDPDGSLLNHRSDLGFDRCTPDQLRAPYWYILPEETFVPPAAFAQMEELAERGELVTRFTYPQIAPVKVYRVK